MILRETARAKVNLTLRVLGRRTDGYHELESLVAFAGIGDELTLEPGPVLALDTRGPGAEALAAGENLVLKAARAARAHEPRLVAGRFVLEKHLPVAAGLGGGSADAAAALRLLAAANPELAPAIPWPKIAASVGADVPVCLLGRAAMMCGIGDRIFPLASMPAAGIVLANPRRPLPTASVFAALGLPPEGIEPRDPEVPSLPIYAALEGYVASNRNDLEWPAIGLCPVIEEVLRALGRLRGVDEAIHMSGSGPTCFALLPTLAAAETAAASLAGANPAWWVTAATLA